MLGTNLRKILEILSLLHLKWVFGSVLGDSSIPPIRIFYFRRLYAALCSTCRGLIGCFPAHTLRMGHALVAGDTNPQQIYALSNGSTGPHS